MSPTNASLPRLISFVSFVADATIGSHSIETSAILTGTWHARTFIDVCKKKKRAIIHTFKLAAISWTAQCLGEVGDKCHKIYGVHCYNKTELYTLSFRGKSWSHRAKQIKSSWNTKRQVSNQAGKWRLLWWKLIIYSIKILISSTQVWPMTFFFYAFLPHSMICEVLRTDWWPSSMQII